MEKKILRFKPEDWEELKDSIMAIEKTCFHPNIQEKEERKKELLLGKDRIVFLAEVDGKIVGEADGLPLTHRYKLLVC